MAESPSAETAVNVGDNNPDTRVWAFNSERDALAAAQLIAGGKLNPQQRRKLLARLRVSYNYASEFLPLLCERLDFQSIDERHEFFDWVNALIDRGINLSAIVNVIARQMTDNNYALRQKAAAALIRMGSISEAATARALGLLRSPFDDVRENALNLLAAIGPQIADSAIPKIEQMQRANLPSSLAAAAEKCLRVLRGELRAASYLPIVKIKPKRQTRHHKIITAIDCDPEFAQILARLFAGSSTMIMPLDSAAAAKAFIDDHGETDLAVVRVAVRGHLEFLRFMRTLPCYQQLPIYVRCPQPDRKIMFATAEFNVSGFFYHATPDTEILLACKNALHLN